MEKFVYSFNEGSKDMRNLLGGKGANLAEMTKIGLPVPFGFTITTDAYKNFYENKGVLDEALIEQIMEKIKEVENVTGKGFGNENNPLLVSVRVGLEDSSSEMKNTVLNLGINDKTVVGMEKTSNNSQFAYNSYKRFIEMFARSVLNVTKIYSEDDDNSKTIIEKYKSIIKATTGKALPQDPMEQLIETIKAAYLYRKPTNSSKDMPIAISVQAMAFGNKGNSAGSGVGFTRNPFNGSNEHFGKFIINSQGVDLKHDNMSAEGISEMEKNFPEAYRDLTRISEILEKHYKDMQEMEFTIQDNKLYMLQTRSAKRTAAAAIKVAVDMVTEKLIDKEQAVLRIEPAQIEELFNGDFDAEDFDTIMSWADGVRTLKVRANADNPEEAKKAVLYGAEGIGLCRTEHMFFEKERILAMRRVLMAESKEARDAAINMLFPFQKSDFIKMYQVLEDKPVTIRLLDIPMQEFLPETEEEFRELSESLNMPLERVKDIAEEYHEYNPILGHRGCRLAITWDEIGRMQAKAIMEAAIALKVEKNIEVSPEIMIPLVGSVSELTYVKGLITGAIEKVMADWKIKLDYFIGTMIEIPRAALISDEIAKGAEFFSFGTNDLTQLTYGFSKIDTDKIISDYLEKGILKDDPFQTLDQQGVGRLMEMAVKLGRQSRPNIKIGICGKHGGDPRSIEFCQGIGLNYVSCAPRKVPVARLAAAQAALKNK